MNSTEQHKFLIIKKKKEIKYIFENGFRIKSNFGTFFLSKIKDDKILHAAVLIKRSVGNAVKRNYCKRIVREYIQNNVGLFGKFNNIIFLFTFSGPVSYKNFSEDLNHCLKSNIERAG